MKSDKKKICLIGWYGKGGVGDDIIADCIKRASIAKASEKGIDIEFVKKIDESDLILIGGGSLLGFDCLNLGKKLKKVNKPIVILGAGYRREKRALDEKNAYVFKKIISRASLVGVRGYVSKQMLLQNRIINNEEVEVIGDPAFLFDPISGKDFGEKFRIGMVVRNANRLEPQYVNNKLIHKKFAELGDYLVRRFKAKLYFFSFIENIFESDTKGARKTLKMMTSSRQAEIMNRIADPRKLGSMMGEMNLVVSQRLHPCLLAWLQGVPSIGFDYQFNKTIDVMNSIGMDEFVIRTDELSLNSYKKKLDRLIEDREIIISQAKISIKYWREKLLDFIKRTLEIIT